MLFVRSRILCPLVVVLTFIFGPAIAGQQGDTWINDYTNRVFTQAAAHNIPGVAIVIVRKDKPPVFKFFGKTEYGGQPIDIDTKFRLASVSKTFTAVLIAKQHTENTQSDKPDTQHSSLINWQTPISQLTPEYNFDNYSQPVLLRHIIGQSAGFMPNAYDNLIEANYKRTRVLKELGELESICKPGYCYTYQNALFGVLEEYYQTQNSSFADQLNTDLFAPLEMKASVGKQALEQAQKWAKPHAALSRKKWRKVNVKNDYYRFAPAAGINASIRDMQIWLDAMLLEHPDVVDETILSQVTRPRVETRNELRRKEWRKHLRTAHYGLGWRVYNFEGIKLNYHGGWVQGFRADLAFSPELGMGMAILMNAESNLVNSISAQFWEQAVNNYNRQDKSMNANITSP